MRVKDSKGCFSEVPFTLTQSVLPVFEVTNAVICELDVSDPSRPYSIAKVAPVIKINSNAVPVFSWFYLDLDGKEVQILNGSTVFGGTASINSNASSPFSTLGCLLTKTRSPSLILALIIESPLTKRQ